MSIRVRHCVECPRCRLCYLIGFSPYRNAAYLVRSDHGSREEYTLYCFCNGAETPSCFRWLQAKPCEVSKEAHERGYGASHEIWPAERQPQLQQWFDVSKYVNLRQS